MTRSEIARTIDHTALKPETSIDQIATLCAEAHEHGFASVCVMPYWVGAARERLRDFGSTIPVGTTIGFPLGAHRLAIKVAEAELAVLDGASELDMVINIGAVKSRLFDEVEEEIAAVTAVGHAAGGIVKVILETALLTEEEKEIVCEIAGNAGADFVKTSTGFASAGATVEDVRLMRTFSPAHVRVKASGGIRDYRVAMAMIEAGADRIGTSAGVRIVSEAPADPA